MAYDISILLSAKDTASDTIAHMAGKSTKSLSAMSVAAGNLLAQGISAGIGEIKNMAMAALEMGGQLTDSSYKTGIAADRLQVYYDAAKMASMESSSFDSMIVKMNKNLGSGAAADSLEQIGLSMEQLSGKGPSEQFRMIGSALANVPSQADKTRLAMDIFGKSGADVFALLGENSDAFAANLADSEKNVRPMSSAVVKALDDMGDSIDRAKKNAIAWTGEGMVYAASIAKEVLAPAIEWTKQKMGELSEWNAENALGWQALGDFAIQAFNGIVAGLQFLYFTGKFVFSYVSGFWGTILSNLIQGGMWLYENWSNLFTKLPQLVGVAMGAVATIVKGAWDAIASGNISGIGDGITKAIGEANAKMQKMGFTHLDVENPLDKVKASWQTYTEDIGSLNTDAWKGISDATKRGIASVGNAGGKKGPLENEYESEKKAKDQLAGLYEAGSADSYAMLAKANMALGSASVSGSTTVPMATTPVVSMAMASGGTIAGGGVDVQSRMLSVLVQLETHFANLRTA
jgi:hypothetical protein